MNGRFGFSMIARDENGNVTAAVPKGANYYLPGSWGDMVIKE